MQSSKSYSSQYFLPVSIITPARIAKVRKVLVQISKTQVVKIFSDPRIKYALDNLALRAFTDKGLDIGVTTRHHRVSHTLHMVSLKANKFTPVKNAPSLNFTLTSHV